MNFTFVVGQDSDARELRALSGFINQVAAIRDGADVPALSAVAPVVEAAPVVEPVVEKKTRRSKPQAEIQVQVQVDEAAIQAVSVAAPVVTPEPEVVAQPEPEVEVAAPAPEVEVATPAPEVEARVWTSAEVQSLASQVARRVGPEAVKKLISDSGATRIADFDQDSLQTFAAKLQAL